MICFAGENETIQSASYLLSSAVILTIVQSVFEVGVSIKDINIQALKLHQIKKKIDHVEKKVDKIMINPLIVADNMFKTGFNEIEAKRYEDAQKTFITVINKANEGLQNLEQKTLNMDTFKLCVYAVKLIMCSKIAKYCYNSETKIFLPYSNLSKSDQRLIAKELEKLAKMALTLKNNVEVRPSFFTKKKEKKAKKEEAQNIIDGFLQACYPYLSNGYGWTRIDYNINSSTIKIQVMTSYLPDGEEDKSCVNVGVIGNNRDIVKIHVWVSEQELHVDYKESHFVRKIESGSDMMEVELFLPIPIVISSSGGAQHRGRSLGQYIFAGEHNKRPYYKQHDTIGYGDRRYLYSEEVDDIHWYVGDTLGNAQKYDLYNPNASDTLPDKGWKYGFHGKLCDDPTLMLSPGALQLCGVTVNLSGDVLDKCPEYGGEYHHNGEYRDGRGVYTNNSKLLYQYNGAWCLGDSTVDIGKIKSRSDMGGGGASNCPALVTQWLFNWTATSDVKISCKTKHHNK